MDQLIWAAVIAGLIWVAFRTGRQHEIDKREDLRKQQRHADEELGALGPIAADLVSDRLTAPQADQRVEQHTWLYPDIMSRWRGMSEAERFELGTNMLTLMQTDEFRNEQQGLSQAFDDGLDQLKRLRAKHFEGNE